ncbi:MAG: hypothetical protein WCF23_03870 [Candidatus Nitrosopolaris sp.]
MHFRNYVSTKGMPAVILTAITVIGLIVTFPLLSAPGIALFNTKNPITVSAAVQKTNKTNIAGNVISHASGVSYNNASNNTGTLSKQRTVQLLHNIRMLLNQTVDAYKRQNYTGASGFATTAYLENFEYLEPALLKVDKILKQNTEFMMRGDLRMAIRQKVPLADVQKLVAQINMNLDQAQKLLSK